MLNYRLDNFFDKNNKIDNDAVLNIVIKHLVAEASKLKYRIKDTDFMNTDSIKYHIKDRITDYLKKTEKAEFNISMNNVAKIADNIERSGIKTANTVKVEVQQITKEDYERLELKVKLIGAENLNVRQIDNLITSLIIDGGRIQKIIIYATEVIADTEIDDYTCYYVDEIRLADGTKLNFEDTVKISKENIKKTEKLLEEFNKTVDKYSAVILNAVLDRYFVDINNIKNYIGECTKSTKNYKSKAQNNVISIYNQSKLLDDLDRIKDSLADVTDYAVHFETEGYSQALIRSSSYDNYRRKTLEIHMTITIPPKNSLITKKSLEKTLSLIESYVKYCRDGVDFKEKCYCMDIQGMTDKVYFNDLKFLTNNYSKFHVDPIKYTTGFSFHLKRAFKVDLSSIMKEDKKYVWYQREDD